MYEITGVTSPPLTEYNACISFSGLEYLVAGHEDVRTGKLVVNMKSFVQHWKPALGRRVMHILKKECQ